MVKPPEGTNSLRGVAVYLNWRALYAGFPHDPALAVYTRGRIDPIHWM